MTSDEWKHRAEREAAAILASAGVSNGAGGLVGYSDLVTLLAAAWLQGVNLGVHETLEEVERGFDAVQAEFPAIDDAICG